MPNIAPALNPSLVFSSTHKIISNYIAKAILPEFPVT